MVYYNEIDEFCAEWLRRLIAEDIIPEGDVDTRDIWEVTPNDIKGYTQCHFFAGIGGWPIALRMAGWPDDWEVWTGSPPCQPFSQAGRGDGFVDERHLWPAWFWLIEQRHPPVIFGEQVASKIALQWIDLIQDDLEGTGYAVGTFDLCAASVGAPHIRQRLWFVAERVADCNCTRWTDTEGRQRQAGETRRSIIDTLVPDEHSRMENPVSIGEYWGNKKFTIVEVQECKVSKNKIEGSSNIDNELFWNRYEWIECSDGKYRPIEPGVRPLAYGISKPSPAIGPYGNAIVPQVAAEVIRAYMEFRNSNEFCMFEKALEIIDSKLRLR